MTELEKCIKLKQIGWTYDYVKGHIFGLKNEPVTYKNKSGYFIIDTKIDGIRITMRAHRFAWFYHYDDLPKLIIDHINCDRSDNRICNLRDVSKQQNLFNMKDVKGYCWHKGRKKYKSQIQLNNQSIHLGYFEKEEDARNAYLEAKKIYHII